MPDRADEISNYIEKRTGKRLRGLYNQATAKAIIECEPILDKLRKVDDAKPPIMYTKKKDIDLWRQSEKRKIIRQSDIVGIIARHIASAGDMAVSYIFDGMQETDAENRKADNIGVSKE